MENPEIPGRIQMERFIPVEIFRKKVRGFEVLPFSRFYRNDQNFLFRLFGLPAPGFKSREGKKIDQYFVNGTTQSRSCFRCQKKIHYHLTDVFHRNFRTNGKRSGPALFQFTSILLHHFAAGACCKTTFPHTVFPVHILLQDSSCIWSV